MDPITTPTPETPVPEPVNPVIMPAENSAAQATPEPVQEAIGATDPITMPTPPKAPDPVEEELKAPFKAAEPVPGSIGSAISVPAAAASGANPTQQTPSVAFNDPAAMSVQANQMAATNKPAKKPVSKTTWILLSVVAVVVIGILVWILVKELTKGNG